MPSIGAFALYQWSRLDDRRRRQARNGVGSVSGEIWSIACAIVFFSIVCGLLATGTSYQRVSNLWLAIMLTSHVVVLFGSSFRLLLAARLEYCRKTPDLGRLFVSLGFNSQSSSYLVGNTSLWAEYLRAGYLRGLVIGGPPSGFAWDRSTWRRSARAVDGAWGVVLWLHQTSLKKVLANMGGEFHAPKTSLVRDTSGVGCGSAGGTHCRRGLLGDG